MPYMVFYGRLLSFFAVIDSNSFGLVTVTKALMLNMNICFPVPPRMVQINQNRGHDIVKSVNVSCVADYVYPEPSVEIYHGHGTNR